MHSIVGRVFSCYCSVYNIFFFINLVDILNIYCHWDSICIAGNLYIKRLWYQRLAIICLFLEPQRCTGLSIWFSEHQHHKVLSFKFLYPIIKMLMRSVLFKLLCTWHVNLWFVFLYIGLKEVMMNYLCAIFQWNVRCGFTIA